MVKKSRYLYLSIIFLASILMFSFISAADTPIKVNVMDDFNLSILVNVLDPNTMTGLQSFNEYSNYQSELNFVYNRSSSEKITLSAYAMGTGVVIKKKYFGNYTTGSAITLDLFDASDYAGSAPSNTTNISAINNTSANITENASQTNNSSPNIGSTTTLNPNNQSFFSRFSLSKINIDKSQLLKIGYIILGIIILAIVIFFGLRFYRNKRTLGGFKPKISKVFNSEKKYTPLTNSKSEDVKIQKYDDSKMEQELEDAERKIKEAQSVIDAIRNKKNRRIEAERKLAEARKELEALDE